MVSEATMFVEGEDEKRFFPLWGVTYRLVDTLDEVLSQGDWRRRMEGLIRAALWVDICELRQLASLGIGVKLVQRSNVCLCCTGLQSPVVECGIWVEAESWAGGGILIIHPGDVVLGELLEDGSLRKTVYSERNVVLAVAMRCSRGDVRTVRVCRAGYGCEPAVKHHEVLGHCVEDSDLVWSVVIDSFSSTGLVQGLVGEGLFRHETAHALDLNVCIGQILSGMPCAEN